MGSQPRGGIFRNHPWIMAFVLTGITFFLLVVTIGILSSKDPDTSAVVFAPLVLIILLAIVYVLPGIIASKLHKQNSTGIWLLTLLGGWTGIGWLVALIWACMAEQERSGGEQI